MLTIFKYPLLVTDQQYLKLPVGAKALSVQVQNGEPCLWAQVESDESLMRGCDVYMHGTGHPIQATIDANADFLGTIQLRDGALVFHVFTSF